MTTNLGLEKVDLFLSAKNLPKIQSFSQIDAFGVISIRNGRTNITERINDTPVIKDNPNPSWAKPISCDYLFEVEQDVVVSVYHWDNKNNLADLSHHTLVGTATFKLSNLMRAKDNKLIFELTGGVNKGGSIEIHCESQVNTRDLLCVTFSGSKLANKDGFFGTSDPFLVVSRMNEDGGYTIVWKSKKIDNTLNPKWSPTKIPVTQLCNGDMFRPLKIEIFDWDSNGKHDSMGVVETTGHELLTNGGRPMAVIEHDKKAKKKNYTNSGHLLATDVSIEHKPTFTDFISHGLELSLIVAIDFTGSNGDPSVPSSLHYINSNSSGLNPYQRCITSVGKVLEAYDVDRKYPVYGFGARVRTPNGDLSAVQHCFPVYGGGQEVEGVDGILQAYKDCVENVQLSGPTLFTQIIQASAHIASTAQCSQTNQKYTILLIITDGVINDMEQTKRAIVNASTQPLSIIIIGVGSADFSGMKELDGDTKALFSGCSTAARDIVQFVAYQDQEVSVLASQVLAEIPSQVLQYMEMKGITPNKPPVAVPVP